MLIVFGDSHSRTLSGRVEVNLPIGYKNIRNHFLEGALAYNLMDDDGSLGKWGSEIIERLKNEQNITGIMLVFGEIDIRAHIIKDLMKKIYILLLFWMK